MSDKYEASNGATVARCIGSLEVTLGGGVTHGGGEFWLEPWAVYALREYFQHESNKDPWEDAKEGDVWIVTPSKALTGGESVEYPAIFQAGRFRDHGGSWETRDLVAARRIWPESD